MKPAPFDYIAPASIDEACKVLADAGGGATVIAGGQTLIPLLALRMSQPFILVDINRIPELQGVTLRGDTISIGPMTRQNDGLADETLRRHLPLLITALGNVGHHQTRNRGTIGGSIALGEPAAEMPATAVALGATLELTSVRGVRSVPASEFYLGPYMTTIEPDELLTAVVYPAWPDDSVHLFREITQRPGDFAMVGLVGALTLKDGKVDRAGIAWFGMGATPIKARRAEAALLGKSMAEIDPFTVAALAIADTDPFDDHHGSAEYRRTVGRRIFERTLREALDMRKAA